MLKKLIKAFLFPPTDSATLRRRLINKYGDMVSIPENVRLENFELEIRTQSPGITRFSVGEGCVLSGRFVLEGESSLIQIGTNTFIGGGLFICLEGIRIGSDVMFSWGCTVTDNDAHSLKSIERKSDVAIWKKDLENGIVGASKDWSNVRRGTVSIGDNSWIGFNSIILKGCLLENGCVIGAGSVVTSSFEPFTVAAGNPARLIRKTE
jgi:galactoside O-acetyltransferase